MSMEKEYTLTKEHEGEFGYIDQDGVSHNSPAEWLWAILGGCGCGSAEDFAVEAVKLLELFATDHTEREWYVYDDRFFELMAHWFDKEGLTEHGGSVGSSWLTKKGEQIHKAIKNLTPDHD